MTKAQLHELVDRLPDRALDETIETGGFTLVDLQPLTYAVIELSSWISALTRVLMARDARNGDWPG